jgi:hypothetical protein
MSPTLFPPLFTGLSAAEVVADAAGSASKLASSHKSKELQQLYLERTACVNRFWELQQRICEIEAAELERRAAGLEPAGNDLLG